MKKVEVKVVAMLVVLAMVFSVVPSMAGTVEAGNEGWEEEVIYLDAEVRVIEGQPVLVYETEEGYEKIPFSLPEYAYADGQKMPLQTQGNDILVPTEEGLVAVPVEEFDVVMVDGQMALVVAENPLWLIPIKAAVIVALKAAGVAIKWSTIYVGGKLWLAGVKITQTTVAAGKALGSAGVRITRSSVAMVIRNRREIRRVLLGLGIFVGGGVLWMEAGQWMDGRCINPQCVRTTPDGPGGDVFCSHCARKFGFQVDLSWQPAH